MEEDGGSEGEPHIGNQEGTNSVWGLSEKDGRQDAADLNIVTTLKACPKCKFRGKKDLKREEDDDEDLTQILN